MSDAPQPSPSIPPSMGAVSAEETGQGTLVWVLSIFFWFLPGLIFYLVAKDKPFVYRHAAMALTMGIFTTVAYFIGFVLIVVLVGIIVIPIVLIFHLVVCIMGAMAANKGQEYNPPIVGGLAKSLFKVV